MTTTNKIGVSEKKKPIGAITSIEASNSTKRNSFHIIKNKEGLKESVVYTVEKGKDGKAKMYRQSLWYVKVANPPYIDSATGKPLMSPNAPHKGRVIQTRKPYVYRRLNKEELEEYGKSEAKILVNDKDFDKSGKRAFADGVKEINKRRRRFKPEYKVNTKWY